MHTIRGLGSWPSWRIATPARGATMSASASLRHPDARMPAIAFIRRGTRTWPRFNAAAAIAAGCPWPEGGIAADRDCFIDRRPAYEVVGRERGSAADARPPTAAMSRRATSAAGTPASIRHGRPLAA